MEVNDSMKLGEIFTLQRGFDITKNEQSEGIYPVVSSSGINSYHNEYQVKGPGVVIGRKGTLGTAFYLEGDYWPHDTSLWIKDFKGNDPKFLYYFLKALPLEKLDSGSANPTLNRNFVHLIESAIPKVGEQVRIAKVLTSLDKKIELNKLINAELEAMAKLIYDYWFVQFDFPDANGKPYKSSGGKMVYNETLKREIPDGWGDTSLGDVCELYQPQTISEKEMSDHGEYLVYGANGIIGKYNNFNHEDCVVTITCRGNTCGTINTTRPFCWITGNAMVVNPKYDYLCIDYLVNSLRWANVSTVITGSAQPQITRTNLAPLKLVSPDLNMVNKYLKIVESGHSKRLKTQEENDQLNGLRDWLLPMLMNGQVTVNDASQSDGRE